MQVKVKKINKFTGTIEVPPDKSISHRAVMLGSLCKGKVKINNFSKGEDCRNTLKIFEQMGTTVKFFDDMNFVINNNCALLLNLLVPVLDNRSVLR